MSVARIGACAVAVGGGPAPSSRGAVTAASLRVRLYDAARARLLHVSTAEPSPASPTNSAHTRSVTNNFLQKSHFDNFFFFVNHLVKICRDWEIFRVLSLVCPKLNRIGLKSVESCREKEEPVLWCTIATNRQGDWVTPRIEP